MFPTLLSNLQSLISSRFLVTSFFPTIAFWFGHATMLFLFNAPFQEYVRSNIGQTAGLTAVILAAALIGVAISAYAEAALLPTLQSLMEGVYWPTWIVAIFAPAQINRYERLNREMAESLRLRGAFGTAAGGQTRAEVWQASLRTARQVGNGLAVNNYTNRAQSAKQVAKLARRRRRSRAISGTAINSAVAELTLDLRVNNADLLSPDGDFALETTRQLLWDLIDYADQYGPARYRFLIMKRHFSFGPLPLPPTRLGNIGKTVQGYAVDRYNLNFELLWSRLQPLAQKDKEFGPLLRAAKTHLDFLISCSVLTFLWAFSWAVWLYITSGPPSVFLGVALLGPLAACVWYWVAIAQYRTVADLLRSSVDLFRFELLTAFRYSLPDYVEEERYLWKAIDALHVHYEFRDLRYSRPKS